MSQLSSTQAGGGQQTPPHKDIRPVLEVGQKAPSSNRLPFPNGRLTIVVFLRYCGDPFAEKNFKTLATLSEEHPEVQFIAVSQSSQEDTDRWIPLVGGTWDVQVIVDPERNLFTQWGLGTFHTWNVFNPMVLWSTYKLGTTEGIWNRSGKSGDMWQSSGAFAVDRFGTICWSHLAKSADDMPNFDEALKKLGAK